MIKLIISILFMLPAAIYIIVVNIPSLLLVFIFGIPSFVLKIKYVNRILVSIDQLGNAIMAGDEDETISSRFGRRWHNSIFARFVNKLFFWQDNHVVNAIEHDEGKKDLIK